MTREKLLKTDHFLNFLERDGEKEKKKVEKEERRNYHYKCKSSYLMKRHEWNIRFKISLNSLHVKYRFRCAGCTGQKAADPPEAKAGIDQTGNQRACRRREEKSNWEGAGKQKKRCECLDERLRKIQFEFSVLPLEIESSSPNREQFSPLNRYPTSSAGVVRRKGFLFDGTGVWNRFV
ncbi:hypothetical protein CDAR_214151 [Caerostris darwini]|uniref:Uncharacterized protein n=1 Tax=Caerostris darwini TaxID=1538125 RepID=A0AAV4S6J4_9ARAC|nr:hypothetical protein CDAR_214151 [Caerostris darwini]